MYDPAKVLRLPADLSVIGEEAFMNVTAQFVEIPAGVTAIGRRAFSGSSLIGAIILGDPEVDPDAFEPNVVVIKYNPPKQ